MRLPIHILKNTIPIRILLHQLKSKFPHQTINMSLIRITRPRSTDINASFTACEWYTPSLASYSVSSLENDAGEAGFLDVVGGLEAA